MEKKWVDIIELSHLVNVPVSRLIYEYPSFCEKARIEYRKRNYLEFEYNSIMAACHTAEV